MVSTITKIWKNRKEIMEGIRNAMIRDEFVEMVAKLRSDVCDACDLKDTKGKSCVVKGTAPCCSSCGCSLAFKTRSLSSECPEGKWYAVITEEDEDKLDNLK
jgi:hypothetical protein